MRCPFCGTGIEDDSLFCPVCGNKIEKQQSFDSSEGEYCPVCGTFNPGDSDFCCGCGQSLHAQLHGRNYVEVTPTGKPRKNKSVMAAVIVILVILLFALVGGLFWFIHSGDDDSSDDEESTRTEKQIDDADDSADEKSADNEDADADDSDKKLSKEEEEKKAEEEKAAAEKKAAEEKEKAEKEAEAKKAEEEKKAKEAEEYILPQSSTTALSSADIKSLSLRELNYARNEIFARHGRKFASQELQNYFNGKSWYKGTIEPSDFDANYMDRLSSTEKSNIELLKNEEYSRSSSGYKLDQ